MNGRPVDATGGITVTATISAAILKQDPLDMEDYVAIIVAVISLATSILTAALTAGIGPFVTSSATERKARRDSEELFEKYRKKLFSASQNLQSRIGRIIHADLLSFHGKSPRHHDDLYIYTCFVLGELFAWTHILKNQIELLPFALEPNKPLDSFTVLLYAIREAVWWSGTSDEGASFILWSGTQMAISELMTEEGGSAGAEKICIGYGEFAKRWHASEGCSDEDRDSLRYWFGPIVAGLQTLVEKGPDAPEGNTLRRLQHLLGDLMGLMDPKQTASTAKTYADAARPRIALVKNAREDLGRMSSPIGVQRKNG
ncbi:hypothetical protein E8E14_005575 [Neopestalotiopsis sp. 37M]|nr:hypothetical protein E8E14_005575 [Neopestalotiopsis sp. 37M]